MCIPFVSFMLNFNFMSVLKNKQKINCITCSESHRAAVTSWYDRHVNVALSDSSC
jgi:hypothetical protein